LFTTKNSKLLAVTEPDDGWDSECIFSSAADYFARLIADINGAKSTIVLAVYIFSLDELGHRVAMALKAAAARGVKVRIVVDGIGSSRDGERLAQLLFSANAEVRIFHPLPWYWDNYQWSIKTGGILQKFFHFISLLNQRDHRKICIVDGAYAWCGSFNITCDHLANSPPWRDYGVRLTGRPVNHLVSNFDDVWFHQDRNNFPSRLKYFRSNNSIKLRHVSNRLTSFRISRAKQRVWICSAYFSPSGSVIKAIKKAKSRNVDVRIIVTARSDIAVFPLLSSTYYSDLLNIGVSIYCYKTGMLHAKCMLIDGQCVIGSSNINHRSFYHDLEVDVVLSSSHSANHLESMLEEDMDNSEKLSKENISLWRGSNLFGWVLRIVRYWM